MIRLAFALTGPTFYYYLLPWLEELMVFVYKDKPVY